MYIYIYYLYMYLCTNKPSFLFCFSPDLYSLPCHVLLRARDTNTPSSCLQHFNFFVIALLFL